MLWWVQRSGKMLKYQKWIKNLLLRARFKVVPECVSRHKASSSYALWTYSNWKINEVNSIKKNVTCVSLFDFEIEFLSLQAALWILYEELHIHLWIHYRLRNLFWNFWLNCVRAFFSQFIRFFCIFCFWLFQNASLQSGCWYKFNQFKILFNSMSLLCIAFELALKYCDWKWIQEKNKTKQKETSPKPRVSVQGGCIQSNKAISLLMSSSSSSKKLSNLCSHLTSKLNLLKLFPS